MIDQLGTVAHTDTITHRTNSNPIRWALFSMLASVLLASGCSTSKGARSGAKSSEKKSVVSKYLKDEEGTDDEGKLASKPARDGIETRKLIRPTEVTKPKDPSRFDGIFKHVDDDDAVGPRYVD